MRKISTLYKKNPDDLGRVIDEVNPENQWVFDGEGIATRKFDGTAAAIINGELYKRYDVKKGKKIPENAIACQEADLITGHHPHWVRCNRSNPEDKYFFEAFDKMNRTDNGTYELCGERVQGNPEHIKGHLMIRHGNERLMTIPLSFEGLKQYLSETDIEGVVFHHISDGRMCKIRKSDFGIKRNSA